MTNPEPIRTPPDAATGLLGPGAAVVATLVIVAAVAWLAHGARAGASGCRLRRRIWCLGSTHAGQPLRAGGHRLLRASLAFELAEPERTRSVRADRC